MKKTCMIMVMICLVLAIVCMVLNIVSAKPRVSEMSDWRLRLFLQQYGLDQYDGADDLPSLRQWALQFELGRGGGLVFPHYLRPLHEHFVDALADYYGIIPATVPHKSDNPIFS